MTRIGFHCTALILAAGCAPACPDGRIEIYPQHFRLKLGEVIHYTALTFSPTAEPAFVKEFEFATSDPSRLTLISPSGVFKAVAPGTAAVILNAQNAKRRFAVRIADGKELPVDIGLQAVTPQLGLQLVARQRLEMGGVPVGEDDVHLLDVVYGLAPNDGVRAAGVIAESATDVSPAAGAGVR